MQRAAQNQPDPREVDKIETAAERNPLSVLELAHIRHVLQKHFFHDVPDVADIAAGSAGYCPLCPAPVTVTHNDGTAVCANGHRFPVNSVKR